MRTSTSPSSAHVVSARTRMPFAQVTGRSSSPTRNTSRSSGYSRRQPPITSHGPTKSSSSAPSKTAIAIRYGESLVTPLVWRKPGASGRFVGTLLPTGAGDIDEHAAQTDRGTADQLPGARDADQQADDHDHGDRLNRAGAVGTQDQPHPRRELNRERDREAGKEQRVTQLRRLRAPDS